jgi:ketosteroid isomerase-like protein
MTGVNTMEERLQRAEDRVAISGLIARYAHNIDVGWAGAGADPQAVAGLFTEDAEIVSDDAPPTSGREKILAWAEGVAAMEGLLVVHSLSNPLIEIDGRRATGRWHGVVGMRIGDADPSWLTGTYEYQFRATEQGWRISRQHFRSAFQAAFNGSGWNPGPLPA